MIILEAVFIMVNVIIIVNRAMLQSHATDNNSIINAIKSHVQSQFFGR